MRILAWVTVKLDFLVAGNRTLLNLTSDHCIHANFNFNMDYAVLLGEHWSGTYVYFLICELICITVLPSIQTLFGNICLFPDNVNYFVLWSNFQSRHYSGIYVYFLIMWTFYRDAGYMFIRSIKTGHMFIPVVTLFSYPRNICIFPGSHLIP